MHDDDAAQRAREYWGEDGRVFRSEDSRCFVGRVVKTGALRTGKVAAFQIDFVERGWPVALEVLGEGPTWDAAFLAAASAA